METMAFDTAAAAVRGAPAPRRVRAVRSGALLGVSGSAFTAAYALATPAGANRPAILAVSAALFVITGLIWCRAATVAVSRAFVAIRLGAFSAIIFGWALLGLLDGGVAGPLGALIPLSLVYLALAVPPRPFLVLGSIGAVAYWGVVLLGEPPPPGYAAAVTLGFGGVAYLCVRHAGGLASLRRRLSRVSRTDPLTGVLNRRGFEVRLAAEFAESVRTGDPLTLILADLDRFKEINDTYGHQTGDQLLSWAAGRLADNLRASDAAGRLGGDEFSLVLGSTGPEGATVVVDRLRSSLDGTAPASVGYACFPADGTTLAELSSAADARVYADKLARTTQLPSATAVAAVRDATAPPADNRRVSGRERRRRSFADMGWLSMWGSGSGLLYAVVFAAGHAHRLEFGLLAGVLGVVGVGLVLAADRISRAPWARSFMLVLAIAFCALTFALGVLDGGVTTVGALSMVVPMPLIGLATPARVAVPVLSLFSVLYLAVAVLVGASSGWYVVTHLGGALAVSVVCAVQGRAAAVQRRLLTRLSRSDVLTDALNRRGFEERFAAELEKPDRAGRSLALLAFDLDGFKQVNDVHGHAAGDDLLCWVAATLRASLDPHDAVGRFGGDEFVVLLTSQPAAEAPAVAARLSAALAARTAVSAGVATMPEHGTDFDSLYTHADAELYRRKHRPAAAPARHIQPVGSGPITWE
jgi:diguanylate cyclase (GGDEF)-like protein